MKKGLILIFLVYFSFGCGSSFELSNRFKEAEFSQNQFDSDSGGDYGPIGDLNSDEDQTIELPDLSGAQLGTYVYMIDTGVDTDHPRLREQLRLHNSYDFWCGDNGVDEDKVGQRGHGTHTTGIIAQNCPDCSISMAKFWDLGNCNPSDTQTGFSALFTVQKGASIVNYSGGFLYKINSLIGEGSSCDTLGSSRQTDLKRMCKAVEIMHKRDILMVAASGNNDGSSRNSYIHYPASDERVVAVGGIRSPGEFWRECNNILPGYQQHNCNSNYGPQQEFVAPAYNILSTFYPGEDWLTDISPSCGSSNYAQARDLGYCTGTSMASPNMAAKFAKLRALLPYLKNAQLREIMKMGRSRQDDQMAFGYPDESQVLNYALLQGHKPLAPMFELKRSNSKAYAFTIYPQQAMALIDQSATFSPSGVFTPKEYETFVLFKSARADRLGQTLSDVTAKASFYVHTFGNEDRTKLYRLSKADNSFVYLTKPSEMTSFKAQGFRLDGHEGFLQKASAEGHEKLYRAKHQNRNLYFLYPESDRNRAQNLGFTRSESLLGYIPTVQ